MATIADDTELVTLGIDTHADIHVAAALERVGRVLGTIVIPTTTEGANQLLEWASMFGSSTASASRAPAPTAPGCHGG